MCVVQIMLEYNKRCFRMVSPTRLYERSVYEIDRRI